MIFSAFRRSLFAAAVISAPTLAEAGLVARWSADTYSSGPWLDAVSSIPATPVGGPVRVANAFGGRAGINFNGNSHFRVEDANNPLGGKTSFTIAAVFKATAAGNTGSNWYQASGLIGGEESGVVNDFGLGWTGDSGGAVKGGAGFAGVGDRTLTSGSQTLNAVHAAVLTYNGATGAMTLSVDGVQVATATGAAGAARNSATFGLGAMSTATGATQPFPGVVGELRMYDSVENGPALSRALLDAYTLPAVANNDTVTMHRGQKARIDVLANDTGGFNPSSVEVVTPPQFGTATADSQGRILYANTSGSPATDTFTYRVGGVTGPSAPATVTINFANVLRIANSSINVPLSPPQTALQFVPAFGSLSFSQPVCMASPPGDSSRLFVCEKTGLLRVIPSVTASTPTASTFLNLPSLLSSRGESLYTDNESGLLGLAFHPNYASNRHFFVFYSVMSGGQLHQRVSRFTTQTGNPNQADPNAELILINQRDDAPNHNGGDLHFGPDGYLYISLGDEGGGNDSFNNSQSITKDFFSGILRIDVDKSGGVAPNPHAAVPLTSGQARYTVPSDNPFVGATTFNGASVNPGSVRTEFWAVGFRNPWRFSFDPVTGELWVGDVGQDAREEVNIVTRGGNYGWAYLEGTLSGPRSAQAPVNFNTLYHTPPLYEYTHGSGEFQGISITGGIVYRGSRIASLQGAYIFADYGSGNVWSLVRNGSNPPTVTRIAGQSGIVAFGTDPSNQDLLVADINSGRILRLVSGTLAGSFPTKLSDTGLFADLSDLSPSPGVLPYTPNLAFWSDFAQKRRWFVIPDGTSRMTWTEEGAWTYPTGQIWVKHFDLPLVQTNPPDPNAPLGQTKRIETRLLVKTAGGSYGVSYRWNDAQTEATLVDDAGVEFDVAITRNGQPATQRWAIPSRANCLSCHNAPAGHALSFDTRQLNRSNVINGFAGNQIDLLRTGGFFTNTPLSPNVLPRHLRPEETSFPLEARVRSYLAVNCGQCHREGGTAPTGWDARPEITLAETGLLNGIPANNGGNPANRLVVPGDAAHSVLLSRVAATNGFTRMPPIASNELDQASIGLITDWIVNELPQRKFYDDWAAEHSVGEKTADDDFEGQDNYREFLAGTDPRDSRSFFFPQIGYDGGNVSLSFNIPGHRSVRVMTSTDLENWVLWDVPGNHGLPQPGGQISLTGSLEASRQFFRVDLLEN